MKVRGHDCNRFSLLYSFSNSVFVSDCVMHSLLNYQNFQDQSIDDGYLCSAPKNSHWRPFYGNAKRFATLYATDFAIVFVNAAQSTDTVLSLTTHSTDLNTDN